jgi:hypothetical protein
MKLHDLSVEIYDRPGQNTSDNLWECNDGSICQNTSDNLWECNGGSICYMGM